MQSHHCHNDSEGLLMRVTALKRVVKNSLIFYRFSSFEQVKHGVMTRIGGASRGAWDSLNLGGNVGDDPADVEENYRRMYCALDVNGDRACSVWQVHGKDTVMVHDPVPGRRWVALADGMVTDQPDTPLMMRYADCVSVLFHDPVKQVIGIAHAGWRGTVLGAAMSVVSTMQDAYGCVLDDIRAGIGPSIGPNCYQVGEEVVEAMRGYFGDAAMDELIRRDPTDGTAYLNLWAANKLDLRRHGIEQIEVAAICTATRTDEFFSHRAEKGKTGRFAAVISL